MLIYGNIYGIMSLAPRAATIVRRRGDRKSEVIEMAYRVPFFTLSRTAGWMAFRQASRAAPG
jgi:hypothetical protein